MNIEKWRSNFIRCPSRLCKNPKMGWTVVRQLGNGLREYKCSCCARSFYFNVKTWQMFRWHPKYSSLKYLPFAKRMDETDQNTINRFSSRARKLGITPEFNAQDCDFLLVLGGDGTMLKAVHNFAEFHKPFVGINYGHRGFLLNEKDEFFFEKIRDEDYDIFSAPLLEAIITMEDNSQVRELALNDIIISEDSGQSALLEVMINDVILDSGLFGDGLIVSTPLGSTAYTANAGGVPIAPTLPVLELTPIAPQPRNRIPLVVPETSIVTIKALELPKRKVKVNQGSIFQHSDVSKVEVRLAKERVELVFFKPRDISWDNFFLERFCEKVYKV